MNAIKIENLYKNYQNGKITALNDISLEVPEKSVFGFLGPNGAGKTTTVKILSGLISSTRGHAWVNQEKVAVHSHALQSHIGYLPQNPIFYPWMSGRELLEFTAHLFKLNDEETKKRINSLLELSELIEVKHRKISTYSGGMVQRLGIAQAVINKPKVLFLDEPCSALDPIGRREVLEFIGEIKKETTVFMSTHILSDVERVCDQVGIINKGSILTNQSLSSLLESYGNMVLEIRFRKKEETKLLLSKFNIDDFNIQPKIEKNKIIFHEKDLNALKSRIMKLSIEQKLNLEYLAVKAPNLEDIFINFIQGSHS